MHISSSYFGVTADGRAVNAYTLSNDHGVRATFLDYGCILRELWVPDRSGKSVDIVLGYDTLSSYETDMATFGALVGRYANRIKESTFTLGGKRWKLTPNEGANHLHGVLPKRVFHTSVQGGAVTFTYHSPDGEEGFPGAVDFTVQVSLDNNNVLAMRISAVPTADTVLNLTAHNYFNLSGHSSGCVDQQLLQIAADTFLETADDTCPTGQILCVEGTPMDFRKLRHIGRGFPATYEQMELVGGYDHCYILKEGGTPAALAYSPATGIALQIATTEPAIQFYSGNYLGDGTAPGKGGVHYQQRHGFCLESQHYPCSPNFPEFPTTVVKAGEVYETATFWQVETLEMD